MIVIIIYLTDANVIVQNNKIADNTYSVQNTTINNIQLT